MSTSSEKVTSFDPARRRLCPDGSCIGLLDETGRCKVCGLVAGAGKAAAPAPPVGTEETDEAGLPDPAADDAGDAEGSLEAAPAEGEARFDPARRLCPDGACVGVLGADHRCPVCGQTTEG
jgi:hypothetical protein